MASLNTLRTKFGYVLSAVIAFALLAFIFSLRSEMGFSSNDVKVGEIASEDLMYTEYYVEYEDVKRRTGMAESTEQEAASLASAAWQSIIAKKLFIPGYEQLGLSMSEAERMDVINGVLATQSFGSIFTDPATGAYNSAAITNFLTQMANSPDAESMWDELNEQARQERATMKYSALVRSGSYVNKLEVAEGVAAANNTYSGKWVSKSYTSIPDSLFTVSDAEIKKFYDSNKELYRKQPTRTLSYVTFDFEPTEQDIVDIENNALAVSREFEAAEDLNQYIRGNLNGSISDNYLSPAQLHIDEQSAFAENKMYGPINNNNVWTMARVVSTLSAPDSIGVRHIVLRYDQADLADSLYTALKGGADFAQAAQQHSLYTQTAQLGGEVGVMPFSSFTGEFIPALASAKRGDIVKVASGDMIQLLEIYRADAPKSFYKVASVEYPVEASQATISSLHSSAGMFSVAAKGGVEKFSSSADEQGVVVKTATITNGDRSIRGVADSRAIARWAYGAEVGDISEIFKTESGYVVAMLTQVDDSDYRSVASVTPAIRAAILRDKKFAEVSKSISGSTIEAVAADFDSEVKEFSNVKFSSQYVTGLGVEPKVVGAISLGETKGVSAPIQGNSAIYVITVDPVVSAVDQTEQKERARAQATVEDRTSQYVFNAVQEMADIKDLRGKFF
ncbi:MAG: SurA N-terminal domain-containing protein [Rikenellaceae bacterium]